MLPNTTGSSSADSAALQPAGNQPLQSTTNDSTGLTAPTGNQLQAPTTGSEATQQLLLQEADGPIRATGPAPDTATTSWAWLWLALLLALMIAGALVVLRDRKRFRATNLTP